MMSIGTNLSSIRKKNGLSQEKLASEIGVTQEYISLIEKDLRIPNLKISDEIAKLLECNVNDFLAS